MVLGCLHGAPLRDYSRYLRGHKRLPLRPQIALTREDGIFADLRRSVLKPQARDARENVWIPNATQILVDKRVSTRQYPTQDQYLIRRLGRAIVASLKGDK